MYNVGNLIFDATMVVATLWIVNKYLGIFNKKRQNIMSVSIWCIFRKNRALAPHERSAVPLGTDHCPVG